MAPLRIYMTAAHGGADSEKTPLGGGATICQLLCRFWAQRPEVELTLLAPGPIPPPHHRYQRIDVLNGRSPASLNELSYASFCRRFEKATTQRILADRPDVVLTHDIAEAPTFTLLARYGIPCVPILHVDVVDFFCRMYLHQLVSPANAELFMRQLRPYPIVPDLLRLVFDKQAQASQSCPYLIVPSSGMVEVLRSTYDDLPQRRIATIPWGAPTPDLAPEALALATQELDRELDLRPEQPLLVMLSRISPEKGQEVLLQALKQLQSKQSLPQDLVVAICGAPAYMQGTGFFRRLQRLAHSLAPQVRVLFPGHLGGSRKAALLQRATIFVSASHHESYGLTTMEAMAYATPVIAVDTPGSRETVNSGCGLIIPRDSSTPTALGQAIIRLLHSPQELQRLSQGALAQAKSYTNAQAAERVLALLQSLKRPL